MGDREGILFTMKWKLSFKSARTFDGIIKSQCHLVPWHDTDNSRDFCSAVQSETFSQSTTKNIVHFWAAVSCKHSLISVTQYHMRSNIIYWREAKIEEMGQKVMMSWSTMSNVGAMSKRTSNTQSPKTITLNFHQHRLGTMVNFEPRQELTKGGTHKLLKHSFTRIGEVIYLYIEPSD